MRYKPKKQREVTPLRWAAENGHEGAVKVLLGQDDVNPDKPDKYGLAPHSWATTHGHEGVVKILLGRTDLNPTNQISEANTTPEGSLEWARGNSENATRTGRRRPQQSRQQRPNTILVRC